MRAVPERMYGRTWELRRNLLRLVREPGSGAGLRSRSVEDARGPELTVVTWNVLAAPWAAPGHYPHDMDVALLDRTTRARLVAAVLAGLDADVICLQETTPPDLARTGSDLGDEYDSAAAPNGAALWSNWSTDAVPWEPNGTAVMWRRSAFTDVVTGEIVLSTDGNVATMVSACHVESGTPVRVMSVHLDADTPELRRAQLPVALAEWAGEAGVVDIVVGDFNEDTVDTELGVVASDFGFRDALSEVGNFDPTHPYARPTDDYAPIARLDHVLLRGAVPRAGRVVDSNVWHIVVPADRLGEHLRCTGSDHLPVTVTISG